MEKSGITLPIFSLGAESAGAVNDGFTNAYGKAMVLQNMVFHLRKKLTAQMNKPAAFYTLQVKMSVTFRIGGVLIAGSAFLIYNEFFDFTRSKELVKGAVYGGCTYRNSLAPQPFYDIGYGMVSAAFLHKFQKKRSLPGAVLSAHYS